MMINVAKLLSVANMKTGDGSSTSVNIPNGAPGELTGTKIVNNIFSTAFFLLGVVAVISLIMAGFKYMTANGDTTKAKEAMNAIIYSIAGLVVAVSAYAITNWVLGRL